MTKIRRYTYIHIRCKLVGKISLVTGENNKKIKVTTIK